VRAPKKIVEVTIEDGEHGRVVISRYANGEEARTPVVKTRPTRKPRMRRQRLMNRTRQKQF
jgi:hypothetical protein